jgi:hypothetical protein
MDFPLPRTINQESLMKELVDMLTKSLGVNASQAEGGAGVLFKAAQDKLGAPEFGKLLGGVPGLTDRWAASRAPWAETLRSSRRS